MKVDHRSLDATFAAAKRKPEKNCRLVWDSKVASITAVITGIVYFHISSPRNSHI